MTIQGDLISRALIPAVKVLLALVLISGIIDIACGVSPFEPIKGRKPEVSHIQLHLPQLTKATPPMHDPM